MTTSIDLANTPLPLRPGIHMIVWPKQGWSRVDPQALAADLVALGCIGAVMQCSDEAPVWIAAHRAPLEAAGLQVSAGLGRVTANAILTAHAEGCVAVLDEEDWRRLQDATTLTATTQADARFRPRMTTDMMYPAEVSTRPSAAHPHGTPTGHAAITEAFNVLCEDDRFPQCYLELPAIPDGAAARSLAWARDPSQWPACGVAASRVRPTVQAYRRSKGDHLALFRAEPVVVLWDYFEMDAACRDALIENATVRGPG